MIYIAVISLDGELERTATGADLAITNKNIFMGWVVLFELQPLRFNSHFCECMDLRVAPLRASGQQPAFAPPFPPVAERCAFTRVEPII